MLHFRKRVLSFEAPSASSCKLKISCNNLNSTLTMVLYASYVCLLHSRFVENHLIDLETMNPSFLR
jgi:hypothetical protein